MYSLAGRYSALGALCIGRRRHTSAITFQQACLQLGKVIAALLFCSTQRRFEGRLRFPQLTWPYLQPQLIVPFNSEKTIPFCWHFHTCSQL